MRPDGHGNMLLRSSGDHPDWSPGGKRIVFDDVDGTLEIDRDGSHLKGLTTRAGDHDPDWSPTGSRIVSRRGPGVSYRSVGHARGRQPSSPAHQERPRPELAAARLKPRARRRDSRKNGPLTSTA